MRKVWYVLAWGFLIVLTLTIVGGIVHSWNSLDGPMQEAAIEAFKIFGETIAWTILVVVLIVLAAVSIDYIKDYMEN